MAMAVRLTESATRPSVHGTNTVAPDHAVPPKAPEQTGTRATWPPTQPSWSACTRYAPPCFPTLTTTPSEGSRVSPNDPRSVSPALSELQSAGAKYDCTWRSGDSFTTELP